MTSAWTGLLVAVVAAVAATTAGLYRRARDGRLRTPAGPGRDDGRAQRAALAGLGATGAGAVTLLQFSSAYCAPCRATARVCADVAGAVPGVKHVEVDAAEHLDAVRALGIMRTPTLLIVDPSGRVTRRAAGRAPGRDDLLTAVGAAAAAGSPR